MPLTELAVKNAKPAAKVFKLSDEKGMYLQVQPTGGKLWRLKYRVGGTEKKLALGAYPEVTLKEARARRDEARQQLADGVDPSEARKAAKRDKLDKAANGFAQVGREYILKAAREGRAAVTTGKAEWLLDQLGSELGARPISDIRPPELLHALQRIEDREHFETARRARSLASRIFRYAAATSRADGDPTALLRGALATPKVKHRAAIVDPVKVGQLLRAIDGRARALHALCSCLARSRRS